MSFEWLVFLRRDQSFPSLVTDSVLTDELFESNFVDPREAGRCG